jgi:hypothetical protein
VVHWNLEQRFGNRVGIYLARWMTIPATDDHQSVHLTTGIDARSADPLVPLVKWLLAIPHSSSWCSWISPLSWW